MRSKIFFFALAAVAVLMSAALFMPASKTQITLSGESATEQYLHVELRDMKNTLVFEKQGARLPLKFEVPADGDYQLVIINQDVSKPVFVNTFNEKGLRVNSDQAVTRLPKSFYDIHGADLRFDATSTYKSLSLDMRP